jgi:hypothetical protein
MEFTGSARYEVLAELGHGGMGFVYHVLDRARGEEVALKTLRSASPNSLRQFKQEFRSIADVAHPNLVTLYEMEEQHGELWFTMELVRGMDFLRYVWGGAAFAQAATVTASRTATADGAGVAGGPPPSIHPAVLREPRKLDEGLLRGALVQLAQGILALHAEGKLHRDIKPSNVLVTHAGRVVVLDFGIVAEFDAARADAWLPSSRDGAPSPRVTDGDDALAAGTLEYMAPEQGSGAPLTAASDWYSFGVTLYQALTGVLPFSGSFWSMQQAKLRAEMPAPRAIADGVPRDLDDLCTALLRPAPEARPTGWEILERLGERARIHAIARDLGGGLPENAAFVGRGPHLRRLREAFDATRAGKAAVARVHGPSGLGKTALVRRFLAEIRLRHGAVTLEGRCHERDALPYKAVDPIVDRLSHHLSGLPPAALASLPDLDLVADMFPAFGHRGAPSGPRPADPLERRRRTFAALRALLDRLARPAPLAIFIDDLQWGDADSAALLGAVLAPPSPPPLLLVTCSRAAPYDAAPPAASRDPWAVDGQAVASFDVDVRPLDPDEARFLARSLLAGSVADADAASRAVAAESGGSPFFLREIVRHKILDDGAPGGAVARLDEILAQRVAGLAPEARRLLQVIAVAGRPVPWSVAVRAADAETADRRALLALRAARLAVTRISDDGPAFEAYHDRVRQAVLSFVPPEDQRARHLDLARSFEREAVLDPLALVEHFRAAGEDARAGAYAVEAAEQAERALAFDRAVQLYRFALDQRVDAPGATPLRARYAEALANAGRGAEAAASYLDAARALVASSPADPRVLGWKRAAAEQYLRSGHLDDGLRTLREVLDAIGMPMPGSSRGALASIAVNRARLWVGRLEFEPRPASSIPPETLLRLDTCWGAALGLSLIDALLAADFQLRHLHMALRVGERTRIARSLSYEATILATVGGAGRRRKSQRLLEQADALAGETGDPVVRAINKAARGASAYLMAEWRSARALSEEAEAAFREARFRAGWELVNCQAFVVSSLAHLGELAELSRRLPPLLREAEERGDVYAGTSLRMGIPTLAWLAADQPDRVRAMAAEAIAHWPRTGFLSQHYLHLVATVHAALYAGDARAAHRAMEEAWPRLRAAQFLWLQCMRAELLHLKGRAALALAERDRSARRGLADLAARLAADLAKDDLRWSSPLSTALAAGAARLQGRTDRAVELLAQAEDGFLAVDMRLYAAAAQHRRAALVGGEQGRALRDAAERWMDGQGITKPARMAAMLVPGFDVEG